MSRNSRILAGLVLSAGVLFASEGCALLTTQRVGTFVATQVGKKVVKDMKEDHDEKKQAEAQQQQQGSQQQVAQEPQGNGPLEPRPTP